MSTTPDKIRERDENRMFRDSMAFSGVHPLQPENDFHIWRSCKAKRRMSKGAAHATVDRMRTQGNVIDKDLLHAYACDNCHGWHVGRRGRKE